MTTKQKRAFELAISNGYYDFPKRIDINKLAKMMGVSFSTYRAHLKKAESKLMRFVFNQI
ncbi:helix-turn-helix domain-containing protein [Nanoarchaeota archaeon]